MFELQAQVDRPEPPAVIDRWSCLNCEHIHAGATPPETCPVCGLPADQFEASPPEPVVGGPAKEPVAVAIIGAGIAGVSAAEAVRKTSAAAKVILLSKEPHLPYFRLNLTRYLAGEITAEQLFIHPEAWYRENNIELRLSTEVRTIDAEGKRLTLRDGDVLPYDRLIVAMGAHSFVPPFPGANRENVTVLRTLRDAEFILGQCRPGLPCVIIGGGVLGLETAGALARRGVDVTVLEGYGWLMPQQLDRTAGDLLARHAASLGIRVRTDVRIKQLEGDERVGSVILEDGESVPAELVVIAAGVRPNSYLVRQAHLEVNKGILVTDTLQTTGKDILAIGDVAEHRGVTYGTWAPAQFQGTIAGMNAVGATIEFAGIPRSHALKVLDFELFSIGQVHPLDGSYQSFAATSGNRYHSFVFHDGQLVGAILLGETGLSAVIKKLIEEKTACADLLSRNPGVSDILSFLEKYSSRC
jgi:nitrite reductase (NADH) large subunit